MGLVAPQHVGSSQTRAQTCVPCIGRRILNHCITRKVPVLYFLFLDFIDLVSLCSISLFNFFFKFSISVCTFLLLFDYLYIFFRTLILSLALSNLFKPFFWRYISISILHLVIQKSVWFSLIITCLFILSSYITFLYCI